MADAMGRLRCTNCSVRHGHSVKDRNVKVFKLRKEHNGKSMVPTHEKETSMEESRAWWSMCWRGYG